MAINGEPTAEGPGAAGGLGKGSIDEMHAEQARPAADAAVPATGEPPRVAWADRKDAPLGNGSIAEMYKDQEATGEGTAAIAKLLADVPSMKATELTASGDTVYPLLDGLRTAFVDRWGGGSIRAMIGKPNSTMEEHFPAAGKSEQEASEELVRIANTDVIKSVTDYKTGELGKLPPGATEWTKDQVDELKVEAMLRGLANQDVLGDGPFAKMVGGVANAARTMREGARSAGSKVAGGLRGLAGRSGGGEPPASPPPSAPVA